MKLEQGYGTLQADTHFNGFNKDLEIEQRSFEKGTQFYVVVEHKNGVISSGIKSDDGFTTRAVGNVFTNENGVRITK